MKYPTRRTMPRTFTIGGETWKVEFVKDLLCDGEPAWGVCDPEKRVIEIDETAQGEELLKTLIHEVLHAIHFEYGFKLRHKKVYALEGALFEFLRDNF